jgi:hypothetical protein
MQVRGQVRAVAAMAAAAMVVASVGACAEESDGGDGAAEVTGEFTGDVSVEETDLHAPAANVEGVEALSPVLDVTTDGEVTGDVEIAIPLGPGLEVTEDEVVFAVTAEEAEGPWELVPAEVRGDEVVVTTTHLSLFQAFTSLVGSVLDVARESFEGLTDEVTAEAEAPSCEDEDGARSEGYDVTSDDGGTVYWCLGRDDEGRYLTVVNNRRYTLLLSHGDALTVRDQSGESEALHEILAEQLTLDGQVTVGPRDAVTFGVDLQEGGSAAVTTQFDGVGGALYQLEVAVDALFHILDRFGVRSRLITAADLLIDSPRCVSSTLAGNAGGMVADCFDFENLRNAFGDGAAVLLSPVILGGTLASFLQTQFNTIGDQFNGRDQYAITVTRGAGSGGGGGDALLVGASFESSSTLWAVGEASDVSLAGVTDAAGGFGVELTDIAAAPDGTFYGVGFGTFYRIDPATGAATTVGSPGVGDLNALVVAPDERLLAGANAGSLIELDPATGTGSVVGSYGSGLTSAGDLAFAPDGTLYAAAADGAGAGVLATVDPATGRAKAALALPYPEVYGLAFAGGDLYGLTTAAGTSCGLGALVRIDIESGEVDEVRCLSFAPGGASPG